MNKICSKCNRNLAIEDFYKDKSRPDGYSYICKACQSNKYQKWSAKTPESKNRHRRWKETRVAENRLRYLDVLAKSDGCVDCGFKENVAALVFDHVEGNKVAGVTALINNGSSWDKIEEEISKCELRCWNHHAIITSRRGNWWTVTAKL